MNEEVKNSIYIVEDMGITRATLTSVLNRNNYNVCGSSATAEKAWIEILEFSPELILLDINLRGSKSGLWLAEKIRDQLDIPIVFLTAYGSNEILNKLSSFNPDGYITKPFNNSTLLGTIKFSFTNFYAYKKKEKNIISDSICFIKTKTGLEKIIINQILYLQSNGNYVNIYLENATFTCRNKLDILLEEFSFNSLKKVHRRFAVNVNKITNINANNILIEDIEVPTSKTYKDQILKIKEII